MNAPHPNPAGAALAVRGLSAGYGKATVLQGIDLRIEPGRIVTVIGPNGAGKSTLLNALMGTLPSQGEVWFDGQALRPGAVQDRVSAAVALVPERRELFADMTVLDNLRLGGFRCRREHSPLAQLDWVYELFPRLRERSGQRAGTLSGGERQMLAVGRALMGRPRLLMLDEPSLGLAPLIVSDMLAVIARLRDHGMSTLLVEQNARAALRIADHAHVLENGRVVLEGPAQQLADHPRVIESYLGMRAQPVSQPIPDHQPKEVSCP